MYIKTSGCIPYINAFFITKYIKIKKEGELYSIHASSLSIQAYPIAGIPGPEESFLYPHLLSGGCQETHDTFPSPVWWMLTVGGNLALLTCLMSSGIVTETAGVLGLSTSHAAMLSSCILVLPGLLSSPIYFPSLPVTFLPESKSVT